MDTDDFKITYKMQFFFYLRLLRQILQGTGGRFIRLTPDPAKEIKFYDKKTKNFFTISVRNLCDSTTVNQIYTWHEYNLDFLARAKELKKAYAEIVKNGRTPLIIDCGANIGASTRYFAEEFPDAKVVAIEPDKKNVAIAAVNCEGLSNVDLREAAVGSEAGYVEIDNPAAAPNAFQTKRSTDPSAIRVETLNGLVEEFPDSDLFIVKIDIEGFEDDLFAAKTEWVQKCPLLIVELHDWMLPGLANSRNFLRVIASEPRDFIHRSETVFSIRNG